MTAHHAISASNAISMKAPAPTEACQLRPSRKVLVSYERAMERVTERRFSPGQWGEEVRFRDQLGPPRSTSSCREVSRRQPARRAVSRGCNAWLDTSRTRRG